MGGLRVATAATQMIVPSNVDEKSPARPSRSRARCEGPLLLRHGLEEVGARERQQLLFKELGGIRSLLLRFIIFFFQLFFSLLSSRDRGPPARRRANDQIAAPEDV